MLEKLQFYIDGQWVDPVEPRTLDVVNHWSHIQFDSNTPFWSSEPFSLLGFRAFSNFTSHV